MTGCTVVVLFDNNVVAMSLVGIASLVVFDAVKSAEKCVYLLVVFPNTSKSFTRYPSAMSRRKSFTVVTGIGFSGFGGLGASGLIPHDS